MTGSRELFSSRWGLLLSAIGMAVGTGNIWRFPRVAASNGGGAFLIAWIIFMFAWALPLVLAEFALGKSTRRGPAGAIGALIGDKYNWMGVFIGGVTCFITFYYSVVTGWCLKYFVASLGFGSGAGFTNAADSQTYWDTFANSGFQPVIFHFFAMLIGCAIIYRGVVGGIERTNRILIPLLFGLLIVAAIRAVTLEGSARGLMFLFNPNWEELLNYRVWLEALTQSAWSVGAGWGLIMTYGVYMRSKDDFVLTGFTTAFADYAASLLAGIAVLCTLFSLAPENASQALGSSGEGLTFVWLPPLFASIPGGRLLLPMFFLALGAAAISSLIAQLELAARMGMDLGYPRKTAVPAVGIIAFVLGLPSAWYLGVFQNQDWAWSIGLMVSGLFVAIALAKYGVKRFRDELINTPGERMKVGSWFVLVMSYLIPLEFVALIGWWFYQSVTAYDPEGWWKPFNKLSVGTVVFQLGVLVIVVIVTNKAWVRKLKAATPEEEP